MDVLASGPKIVSLSMQGGTLRSRGIRSRQARPCGWAAVVRSRPFLRTIALPEAVSVLRGVRKGVRILACCAGREISAQARLTGPPSSVHRQ